MKRIIWSTYFNVATQSVAWLFVFFFYALPNSSWIEWTGWQRAWMVFEYTALVSMLNSLAIIPARFIQLKKYHFVFFSVIAIYSSVGFFMYKSNYFLTRQLTAVEREKYSMLTFPHHHWIGGLEEFLYFLIMLGFVAYYVVAIKSITWNHLIAKFKHLDLVVFSSWCYFSFLKELTHPNVVDIDLLFTAIKILFSCVGVYFIAFFFHNRYFNKEKMGKYILAILVCFIVMYAGNLIWRLHYMVQLEDKNEMLDYFVKFGVNIDFFSSLSLLMSIITVRVIYDYIFDYFKSSLHFQAELASLKAQINPHFLFNTLNTLYSSALQEKSTKTAEGISQLSDMMRYNVYDSTERFVGIKQELEFVNNYISLQQKRIANDPNIQILVDLPQYDTNLKIAPMLFIPFIENAFKHGISYKHPSFVKIQMTITGDSLDFIIENSLHKTEGTEADLNSGIGLENTIKRINLLYPDTSKLSIANTAGKYSVKLNINKLSSDGQ